MWPAAASADQVDEDAVLERILKFRDAVEPLQLWSRIASWEKLAADALRAARLPDHADQPRALMEQIRADGLEVAPEGFAAKILASAAALRAALAAGDGSAIALHAMAARHAFDQWCESKLWGRAVHGYSRLRAGGRAKGRREELQPRDAEIGRLARELADAGITNQFEIARKIKRRLPNLDLKPDSIRKRLRQIKLGRQL